MILSSIPISANLSFGRVKGYFEATSSLYPTECSFSIEFSELIDPATRSLFEEAAIRQGIEIEAIP